MKDDEIKVKTCYLCRDKTETMNNKELIDKLRPFVTEGRYELLRRKLLLRTRYMTVVLENVHHEQNVSAVIRTCECLGIQDLHIIENSNKLSVYSTIDRGSAKWLTIHRYSDGVDNTRECIDGLKAEGYRIVATTPHDDAAEVPPTPGFGAKYVMPERSDSLYKFDAAKGPFAVVIGSERKGISQYVVDNADGFITVPMVGFTESLNLSACAAIIMAHLRHELSVTAVDTSMGEEEREELMTSWLIGSIRNADLVMQRIMQDGAVK